MITSTILVHSSDGIAYRVTTSGKTYEQLQKAYATERRYAESKTAAELDAHGDYFRTGWGNTQFSIGAL